MELIARLYKQETDPIEAAADFQLELFGYSEVLRPWAEEVAAIMCRRAAEADYATWEKVGGELSRAMRKKLKEAGVGDAYARLQKEQVELITSLPLEASKTVHEWTRDSLSKGERFPDIAKRIQQELGLKVSSRAICIARTETARARTSFTQARAEAVGSTHYIWHTCGDGAVREMHAALDGTVQAWNAPPACETGKGGAPVRANPGCVWNCRCWAEPLFENEANEIR